MRNLENNKFNQIKPIVRKRGRYFRYVRGEQWTRTNDETSLEMISYRSIFVQFRDNVEIFPIILRLILNNVSIRCQLSIDIFTHRWQLGARASQHSTTCAADIYYLLRTSLKFIWISSSRCTQNQSALDNMMLMIKSSWVVLSKEVKKNQQWSKRQK